MHQEIVDSLQTTALEIDCAETYAQAISLYARFHYVLVILNLGIPDADGVAIVRRLRQLEQTPILALSAFGSREEEISALNTGTDGYLSIEGTLDQELLLAHASALMRRYLSANTREYAAIQIGGIILPPAMLEVLAEYKKGIFSDLMFPSRVKPEQPIDPGYVRKRLQVILKRAGCKSVRFHDLRHTFATMSLENGMDVKTLSTIIGHVSSATTLNTYTHITDEMRRKAAVNIDQGIAGVEAAAAGEEEKTAYSEPEFTPVQPAHRRPGTGYLKQIGENLWEGRYSPIWPDGKKHSRNVYGHTEAECEEKLAELILQMKAEIAALRSGASTEYPDGVSPKKKAITAYLREHPGVTSKGMIARELGVDRSTVQRYYDEIRAELRGEDAQAS